ncbi:hypothetical protein GN956_G19553 [Arapaima gigas]
MAAVVPFASCYARSSIRPLQLFGGHEGGYLYLLAYHGPRGAPQSRMTYRGPKMTLGQICRMLRVMRQVHGREPGPGANRKPLAQPSLSPQVTKRTEKRCLPACLRRRRSSNIKRVG